MHLGYKKVDMKNLVNQNTNGMCIEWMKRKQNKYVVKFDQINIPIEMNEKYYKNILNYVQDEN
jgi:hypothetical protein